MATIVVVSHARGRFRTRSFMIAGLFPHWEAAGHRVLVHEGPRDLPDADIAILHVDETVIPAAYVDAVSRYRVVVNGRAIDTSKRAWSDRLVARGDAYSGPVIVKTDKNSGGVPEAFHAAVAVLEGEPAGPPVRFMKERYPVFSSACLVPANVWSDPELVVEKFLPEKDERGYYLRTWVFFGDRERCNRIRGASPVVKAADALERTPVPIPDEARAWRARMGFDYGKLDFVVHDGRVVVFDVNRTPTIPATIGDAVRAGMADLANGIDAFLR